jgi:hypothetical protein
MGALGELPSLGVGAAGVTVRHLWLLQSSASTAGGGVGEGGEKQNSCEASFLSAWFCKTDTHGCHGQPGCSCSSHAFAEPHIVPALGSLGQGAGGPHAG